MLALLIRNYSNFCKNYLIFTKNSLLFFHQAQLLTSGHLILFSCRKYPDYTISQLTLKIEGELGKRHITHYNYHSWPDFGNPQSTQFVDMVNKISSSKDRPIVVHCSAGLGRSGVFITVHTALETQAAKRKVDIERIVHNLRKQREGMVQTQDQYRFCYEVTAEALGGQQQRSRTKSEPGNSFNPPSTRPLSMPVDEPKPIVREHRRKREPSIPPPSPSLPPYTEETQENDTSLPRFQTPPPPNSSPPPPISEQVTPVKVAITPDVIVTAPSIDNLSDQELVQRKLDDFTEQRRSESTPSRPSSQRSSHDNEKEQTRSSDKAKKTETKPVQNRDKDKPSPEEKAKPPPKVRKTSPKKEASKPPLKVSEPPKKSVPLTKSVPASRKEPPLKVMSSPVVKEEDEPPPLPASPPPTLDDTPPTPPHSPPSNENEPPGFDIPEALEEPEDEVGFSIGDDQFLEQKPYQKPKEEKKPPSEKKGPVNKPEWTHKKKTQPQKEWSYKTKKPAATPLVKKIEKRPEIQPPPLEVVNREPKQTIRPVGKLNIPTAFGGAAIQPPPIKETVRHVPKEPLAAKQPPVTQPPKWKQDKKPTPSDTISATAAQSSPVRSVGKVDISKFEQPTSSASPTPAEPEPEESGSKSVLQRIKQMEAKGSPSSHGSTPFKLPTLSQPVKLSPTRQLPKNVPPPVTVPLDSSDKVMGLLAKFEKKTNF